MTEKSISWQVTRSVVEVRAAAFILFYFSLFLVALNTPLKAVWWRTRYIGRRRRSGSLSSVQSSCRPTNVFTGLHLL